MTLDEIRKTAFAWYMRGLPRHQQVLHLYTCLKHGDIPFNMGWMLMKAVHGDSYEITGATLTTAIEALILLAPHRDTV